MEFGGARDGSTATMLPPVPRGYAPLPVDEARGRFRHGAPRSSRASGRRRSPELSAVLSLVAVLLLAATGTWLGGFVLPGTAPSEAPAGLSPLAAKGPASRGQSAAPRGLAAKSEAGPAGAPTPQPALPPPATIPSSPLPAAGTTAATAVTPTAPTTGGQVTAGSGAPSSAVSAPAAVPIPAAPAPAPAPAGGNPLAGATFYGTNAGAAAAAAQWQASRPQDATLMAGLSRIPTATWLGAWSGDVAATVRQVSTAAHAAGAVPVFVAYDIPGRDCGGYSSGGLSSSAAYAGWVQGVASGIGANPAVVIVEPDALAQLCGDVAERYRMLQGAVRTLKANAGTRVYLDAGHANWIDAPTMADRLRAAGVAQADGFALNVSNFQTTASNEAYGAAISAALGGAHFVVDTSRNGNGPGSDWCNPSGRAVGPRPTAATGQARVDAFLWIKTPGESDGTCNGGPAAGAFWPDYALGLVRAGLN